MSRLFAAVIVISGLVAATSPAATPRDPLLDKQWGLRRIEAPAAWKLSRGAGAVIAIIDSGVDIHHPDLKANLASSGRDLVDGRGNARDRDGHGTYVAGIAAAVGWNGRGIAGVAPEAKILPVKVCEEACHGEAVAEGIRYSVRQGADVINLSLYVAMVDESQDEVLDAVEAAHAEGVVVVAAAGNSSEPWCAEPAASAVCVGAVDRRDTRTLYSNGDVGMASDYLVAPGGAGPDCEDMVLSTAIQQRRACGLGANYAYSTGTSAAAPFVSGVAALLFAVGVDGETVRECILKTADDLGPGGRDPLYGFGRVNAVGAVRCAARVK